MFKITDSVTLSDSARLTPEGYLEAAARTARTGIQQYLGSELGRPDLGVVNVYRDESEVFNKGSLGTFSKIPVTNDHPNTDVTADNWRDLAVGVTGDDVLRDGEYLKIGIKITDANAVKLVHDGKRELSVGYSAEIVWQDGVAPDGTEYQAIQRNIRANHVAIVDKGRAGAKARIGDSWGAEPITDSQPGITPKPVGGGLMTDQLKTVVLGDKAVQVAVTDVAAIEQFKADSAKAIADAQSKYQTDIAAKDTRIGELQAELQQAKDAANIDIDALVSARTELVSQVKAIDSAIDTKGKTDAQLRKEAVAKKLGDAAVADANDDQIAGMFKVLAAQKPANPVADAFRAGITQTNDHAKLMNDALQKANGDMNAWRYQ